LYKGKGAYPRKYKAKQNKTRDVSTHNQLYANKMSKKTKTKATQATICSHSSVRLIEAKDSAEFSLHSST
jgi:hypothetical protein